MRVREPVANFQARYLGGCERALGEAKGWTGNRCWLCGWRVGELMSEFEGRMGGVRDFYGGACP